MFRVALPCFVIIATLNYVICLPDTRTSNSPWELNTTSGLTSLVQEVYAASFKDSPLDPMFHNQIQASLPTLVYNLTDTTVKGLKSCQIENSSVSSDKTSVHIDMLCPRFEIIGHYVADGAIKKVAFEGNGKYTMVADNYLINLDINIETTERNGKKYTKIIDFQVKADLKGDLDIKLGNLFRGNTERSAIINKFIKENPVVVAKTVQNPVLYANFNKLIEGLNKYMENTPVDFTK